MDFWDRVDSSKGLDACWPWNGIDNPKRYGKWHNPETKKKVDAHKHAAFLTFGEAAKTYFVCHTCDNRSCCNPLHLFLGSQKDNMKDCASKRRLAKQQNTHCPQGHPYEGENLNVRDGYRECLTCRRANDLARWHSDKKYRRRGNKYIPR